MKMTEDEIQEIVDMNPDMIVINENDYNGMVQKQIEKDNKNIIPEIVLLEGIRVIGSPFLESGIILPVKRDMFDIMHLTWLNN
jgi:hypothetical protein